MISIDYVRLMAAYNQWQNLNLYSTASALSDEARRVDRGAFFGSIHATLNHLLWADQIWLSRLSSAPAPTVASIKESTAMHEQWSALAAHREATDERMVSWANGLQSQSLDGELRWFSGASNREVSRPRWVLVTHLFNHGTHHRGQVHAMLTDAGAKPGATDLPFLPSLLARREDGAG